MVNIVFPAMDLDDVLGSRFSPVTIEEIAKIVVVRSPVSSVAGRTGLVVLSKSDVGLANIDNTADVNKPVSSAQQTALNAKADLVGGVIPQAQIPAIALTEFLGAVSSQAAMLALTGQRGDWCTRTDRGTDFQLIAEPSTTLANWRERTYPASPVSSVAGRTGAVTLSKSDVGLANVDNTADTAKPVSTPQQTALNSKADLVGGIVPTGQLPAPVISSVAGKTGAVLLVKADVGLGNVDNTSDANKPVSTLQQTALNAKADLVSGVIPQAQIPAIAVTDFLGAVASQSAMLGLTGQRGDWCTRTDRGTDWQLIAEPSTAIGSWRERTYPASPVSSVAGRVGAVTISTDDVTDMTAIGKSLAKAADAAAGRTALGISSTGATRPISTAIIAGGTVLAQAAQGSPAVMGNVLTEVATGAGHTFAADGITVPTGLYIVRIVVAFNANATTIRAVGVYDQSQYFVNGGASLAIPHAVTIMVPVTAASAKLSPAHIVDTTTVATRTLAAGNVSSFSVQAL